MSGSTPESFEFVDDLNNDQKLISPSLSSVSTDCNIEEFDTNVEFKMDGELKDKPDMPSVSTDPGNQSMQQNNSIGQSIGSEIVNSPIGGDNLDFDNRKLQEALNMQIQANQQHLESSQQQITQTYINSPQLNLFNQSNVQPSRSDKSSNITIEQMQEINYKLNHFNENRQNLSQFVPSAPVQPAQTSNQQSHERQQQQLPATDQISTLSSNSTSNEIAKIAPPIPSNFDPASIFGWFAKQDFINKVADSAVNGFNSVLITLDPQMKEIRLSGGPNILVCSNHQFDIEAVRDGFLGVFKRATVKSIDTFLSVETAIQLVGWSTAHRISLERIKGLRSNISIVPQNQIIVSIENFLYNFDEKWFDSDYILLDDPLNKIQIAAHTQGTPIEERYVEQLKSSKNHKFRNDGFSVRLDSIIASDLNCSIGEWHKEYVGFDKSMLHNQAIILLSNLYKNKLKS